MGQRPVMTMMKVPDLVKGLLSMPVLLITVSCCLCWCHFGADPWEQVKT